MTFYLMFHKPVIAPRHCFFQGVIIIDVCPTHRLQRNRYACHLSRSVDTRPGGSPRPSITLRAFLVPRYARPQARPSDL